MPPFGTEISGNRRRGCELSPLQRTHIIAKRNAGLSNAQVAREIGCHPRSIQKTMQRAREHHTTESKPRSGGPKKLTERDERRILLVARRDPGISLAKLRAEAGTSVSLTTIIKILRKFDVKR